MATECVSFATFSLHICNNNKPVRFVFEHSKHIEEVKECNAKSYPFPIEEH